MQIRGLTKYYGRQVGIQDLTLDIHAGEVLGFLGPNGAGKSTLLRGVNGLNHVTRGSIEVFDGKQMVDVVSCDEATLRRIRQKSDLPVIFLTSKDEEIDELFGLFPLLQEREHASLVHRRVGERVLAPLAQGVESCLGAGRVAALELRPGDAVPGRLPEPVVAADWMRIAELVARYRDLPLGSVDASVVAAAERLGVNEVATFDRRHFGVVRPAGAPFVLLP